LIYAARVGAANPAVGESIALDVITAVLIGGTSITGGKGRIAGTILGVFLLTSMINGLHLLGMGTYWQMVFVGSVLLAVIIMESRRGGWHWHGATGRMRSAART
jgi:ribose transport system permease protein